MQPTSIAATSAALLVLAVLTPREARAQSAEALALFSRGDKLMEAGDIGAACEAFEASNRIEPRAGALIRLGACRERNHQLAAAWSAYNDALTRVKDPRKKAIARKRVAALEPRLSYLTVSVADDSRVDGLTIARNGQPLEPAQWNHRTPVDGGDYMIAAAAPGRVAWQTVVTVANESGDVTVEVPRLDEIAKPVVPQPVVVAPRAPVAGERVVADKPPSRWTLRRKLALGIAVASAAGWTTGIVLGVQAGSKRDAARGVCADPDLGCGGADRANALLDQAKRRAFAANIAFGAAAAATVAAGVLWFTGRPDERRVVVIPVVGPGEIGVAVARSL